MHNPIPRDLPQRVRTLQAIWFALVIASAIILAVFWYLRDEVRLAGPWQEDFSIALILAGVGLLLTLLAFVIPNPVAAQVLPGHRPSFATYQVAWLVRVALLEGATQMQGVAYLLEGEWGSLALGGAILLILLGSMPTRDAATRWLQRAGLDH